MINVTLSKARWLRFGLLAAALVVLVGLIAPFAQAIQAGSAAEESLSSVLSVKFQDGWQASLESVCTENGRLFWTAQLTALEQAGKASGLTVDTVDAEAVGQGEPYQGLAGKGRIVTLKLKVTSHDAAGQTFEDESTLRLLTIREEGKWLLDGPAPEIPHKESK